MAARLITAYAVWSAFRGRRAVQERRRQLDRLRALAEWLRANPHAQVWSWVPRFERHEVTYGPVKRVNDNEMPS